MKMTVDASMMQEMFKSWDRNYYTYEGCEALLEFYDEIDENMEFDPIAICCDCTEYGENAACSFDNLISDYGYKYSVEEYKEDNDIEENDFDESDYIAVLVEVLEDETTVLHVENGNYIVFAF